LGARSDGGGVAIFWVHATIATQQRHATGFLGSRGDSGEATERGGLGARRGGGMRWFWTLAAIATKQRNAAVYLA